MHEAATSTGRVEQRDKEESFLLKSDSRSRWDDDETWIRDTVREDRNKSVLDLFTFWARKSKVEDRILFFVARKSNCRVMYSPEGRVSTP